MAAPGTNAGQSDPQELVHSVMTSDNPHQTFDELPEDERDVFTEAMAPTAVEETVVDSSRSADVSLQADGCWNQTVQQDFNSNFGFTTYSLFVSSHWCSTGNQVTQHSMTGASGEAVAPGYSFQGITSESSVNHGDRGVSAAQGQFRVWNAPDWIPGGVQYPCAIQTTHPTANSSVTGHVGGACLA